MTGNFTPVFVSLGLILLSTSLGAYSLERQLAHSPTVRVSKKRRETLPEVDEPERVAAEAEQYVKSSIFRKVAHVQDPFER
ncbi:hypothetical protein AXF42_Ash002162 [Apostasia shenzhenica]|uniref:Uncharacterized protein n=1 Tax=Apostasia shenzhenica TaxID=1088818 RepID=A0A2I0AMR9_9ASPA|nr:hypothetical protein AXF42_Ash002162 [Apostasia shenzhenica]